MTDWLMGGIVNNSSVKEKHNWTCHLDEAAPIQIVSESIRRGKISFYDSIYNLNYAWESQIL